MRSIAVLLAAATLTAAPSRELRFSLPSDPKTFDALQVSEQSSEMIRYLTGGVLVRIDRATDKVQPELAESWKLGDQGRAITFRLRSGLKFSDGATLTANDVARTLNSALDPALAAPVGDTFRSDSGNPEIRILSPLEITIRYAQPKPGIDRLFDALSIVPANQPKTIPGKLPASAGPFSLAEYRPGEYVKLARNPNYWKRDPGGKQLPYLDSIRIDIQPNHDIEMTRFLRGETQLIDTLDPESFDRVSRAQPRAAGNPGPSLDSEFLWFNQSPAASVPTWKRKWFASAVFRHAVSMSIRRDDIVRIVYRGHAHPAAGPVSPANRFWFNGALKPLPFDSKSALRSLASEGFTLRDGELHDHDGHVVEFSLITNAGNRPREAMAAVIQDDLRAIGIRVNIVTLDFSSLIERIMKTSEYEAALLGLANTEIDPSAEMNVWLSSGPMHAWWPSQKSPATPWEAAIDKLELAQASEPSRNMRKKDFDEVQRIVVEREPIIYLVNPDCLAAIAPSLHGTRPVASRHRSSGISSGCALIEQSPALECRISASYGRTPVLHDVECRIAPGEIVALVGLSGSGKSTLALSLLQLLHYRAGEVTGSIRLTGRELSGLAEREMRGIRGKLVGYVPQSPASALNGRLRVRTLLEETWRAHERGRPSESFCTELLESVQLPARRDFLNQRAAELSAGQGQRLLIAMAIMHRPAVLLADEPTSALDAITQMAVLRLFRELNQRNGTAMLFISHDLPSVASVGHRVEILHEGRIVESGPPEAIFRRPRHPFTRALVGAIPQRDW